MEQTIPNRTGPESRTDKRRAAILEAATEVIAREGLSGTTMERVAGRAGISPGTVTFHFARKEALLLATLDHVVALFEAGRLAALEAAVDALLATSLDPKRSNPGQIAVWTAFWGEAKARKLYMQRVGAADRAFHEDLVRLFEALLDRNGGDDDAPSDLRAEALARGFGGLIDGLWQDALEQGRRFDRTQAGAVARAYLNAVFPDEPLWQPRAETASTTKGDAA
jgi:AcrR family transcriptional regulator